MAGMNLQTRSREKIPLSEDEIKRLMDFCINSGTYCVHVPFLTIAIGTCLRCGELTGLTWNDIDMKNRTSNGQPFAINAVNSFLLNMEKAYKKAHPEEPIPHLSAHILRHTGVYYLHPQEWI